MGGSICLEQENQENAFITHEGYTEQDKQKMGKFQKDAPTRAYAILKGNPQIHNQKQINETLTRITQQKPIKPPKVRGNELPAYYIKQKHVYYMGEWLKGRPHGKGKIYIANGTYFEGGFQFGQPLCEDGVLIYPDGSYYRGGISADSKFSGTGQYFYKLNGLFYNGQWKNDKPQGRGEQTFSDGNRYVGDFKNGLKDGRGKFTWKDGRQYEGEWLEGYMHGKGIFKKGNAIFDGTFEMGLKKSGELRTQYGSYFGKFVNGEMEDDNGKFVWNDNKTYIGSFKNGKMHGKGVMEYSNKQRVLGQWVQGESKIVSKIQKIK